MSDLLDEFDAMPMWLNPYLPPPLKFAESPTFLWDGPVLITTRQCGPFVLTTTQVLFGYAQKAITA